MTGVQTCALPICIKTEVKRIIKRGKLDVSVMVENTTDSDINIRLNTPVAGQYYDNLRRLQKEFDVSGDISLEYLASMPDVLKPIPDVEDESDITRAILGPVRLAAQKLDEMRITEGGKLAEDLLSRGSVIQGFIGEISACADDVPKTYAEKLRVRIKELVGDSAELPEERIAIEAAIFADKCSIAEELTRLSSHMEQMKAIIAEDGQPDGKRLDFLVQEMNREANTIGSKANDLHITSREIGRASCRERV